MEPNATKKPSHLGFVNGEIRIITAEVTKTKSVSPAIARNKKVQIILRMEESLIVGAFASWRIRKTNVNRRVVTAQ